MASPFFNHRIIFDIPGIPARLKNRLHAEIAYNANDCFLESLEFFRFHTIDNIIIIKGWMLVKWIEEEKLIRLPDVGVGTVNRTLEAISGCLSE